MNSAETSIWFARFLCSIFSVVAIWQRGAIFNTLQLSGNTQCCTDNPSAMLGVRSARECSLSCVAYQDCCLAYNFKENEMSCELFDNVTSTSGCTVASGCSFYLQTGQINSDPQFVASENCSFPFTWAGQLYYSCAYDPSVSSCFKFCFLQNRTLAFCNPWTIDYQVFNETVNMTISTMPTSPPVLVQTVNGWIVIQQKLDASYSFNRTWAEFQNGFGELNSNYYWIGLDRIHALTGGGDFKLRVELQENVTGLFYSVEYLYFQVDDSTSLYTIHVGGYSGDTTDGLLIEKATQNINGMNFSTIDNRHDRQIGYGCASTRVHGGGWWYNDCAFGEPNGAGAFFRWYYSATGGFMLQTSRMMVKPADK